eukprot:338114-Prorocentrum_minimum.AAC.1
MGHFAPLGERQARCTSAHTPPLGSGGGQEGVRSGSGEVQEEASSWCVVHRTRGAQTSKTRVIPTSWTPRISWSKLRVQRTGSLDYNKGGARGGQGVIEGARGQQRAGRAWRRSRCGASVRVERRGGWIRSEGCS